MIVSLVSQKGGVGKSTIARMVAVELATAGWDVKIADLDVGQGTSSKWKARRDVEGIKPEIPVEKYATVDRAIRDARLFNLMILDGPAHAEKGGITMAKASDLVIFPSNYSLDDLEPQVEAAHELIRKGVDANKIRFVFSQADGSASEDNAARDYLKRAGVLVLENVLPQRPSIRQGLNIGLSPSEVQHSSVRKKVKPLAIEIANLIISKNTPEAEEVAEVAEVAEA